MVEKGSELEQRLHRRRRDRAMLIEHHALGRIVTTEQRADQQAVMLVQLLHGGIRGTMQLDESLLTAAAEKGSIHVGLLWDLNVGLP